MDNLFADIPTMRNLRGKGLTPAILPPNSVYIGRAIRFQPWPTTKWANPFKIGLDGDRDVVIAKHAAWLCDQPTLMAALPELRGRDLWCWCAPEACHGDVLLRLANG